MAVSGVGSQGRAQELEQEAQTRIRKASEQLRETDKELEDQLETKRQKHAERMSREAAKQEGEMLSARDKHNARLLDLKTRFGSAEGDLKRTAEKEISKTEERLEDEYIKSTREGEKKSKDLSRRLNSQEEYERLGSRNRIETLKRDNQQELSSAISLHRDKMTDIYTANEKKYNELKENHGQATAKATEHFDTRLKTTLSTNDALLTRIESDASRKLGALRESNTQRLDAYRTTRSDPFYRNIELRADLEEGHDGYVLTARVPAHEQSNVSVNVRGNQIVLSGKRQTTERLEGGPGEVTETSAYQSFSRTFPITWPVEPTYLRRETVGDTLIISIPKKEFWDANPVLRERKVKPDPHRAQRPNFPSDLPVDGFKKSDKKTPGLG